MKSKNLFTKHPKSLKLFSIFKTFSKKKFFFNDPDIFKWINGTDLFFKIFADFLEF